MQRIEQQGEFAITQYQFLIVKGSTLHTLFIELPEQAMAAGGATTAERMGLSYTPVGSQMTTRQQGPLRSEGAQAVVDRSTSESGSREWRVVAGGSGRDQRKIETVSELGCQECAVA